MIYMMHMSQITLGLYLKKKFTTLHRIAILIYCSYNSRMCNEAEGLLLRDFFNCSCCLRLNKCICITTSSFWPLWFFPILVFDCLLMSNFQIALFAGIWHIYCWALETSSMKIRDIVVQPVYASASLWPLLQFPTQNPTRTFPLWMLLQWPSMWRWRWRLRDLPAPAAI